MIKTEKIFLYSNNFLSNKFYYYTYLNLIKIINFIINKIKLILF